MEQTGIAIIPTKAAIKSGTGINELIIVPQHIIAKGYHQ